MYNIYIYVCVRIYIYIYLLNIMYFRYYTVYYMYVIVCMCDCHTWLLLQGILCIRTSFAQPPELHTVQGTNRQCNMPRPQNGELVALEVK